MKNKQQSNIVLKTITGITALCILSGSLHAQQVNRFSANQAMEYALKNAVDVKNSLINYQIQKQTNNRQCIYQLLS